MQLPIGREADFEGVIDLVAEKAIYFDGANGENVRDEAIPGRAGRRGPRAPGSICSKRCRCTATS